MQENQEEFIPSAPGGAERETGGSCCLVQVASGVERLDAGQEDAGECIAN